MSVAGSVLVVGWCRFAAGGGRRGVWEGVLWCHGICFGSWLGVGGIWLGSGCYEVAEWWCRLGGKSIWLGFLGIMKLLIHHSVNVKDDFHSDGYAPVHRVCWGNTGRHAETLKVLRDEGGVDIANLASRHKEGKVCRQMTNNPTIFALLEETLSAQDHTAPSQDEL